MRLSCGHWFALSPTENVWPNDLLENGASDTRRTVFAVYA